ncbi:hypothetical protein BG53_11225 [Paenibacillus darwinianus]|uniref:Ferric siderophore reductase C-terminal domain-containing protein n=1 Tax=Paenibacillus darwinianus TaxID=1380763 RepID=A0A9W5W8M5_9BACL|nr:hypothetical protein [Paenibacillus darwinianus]EXX90744.1 hypothetical protein BG52_12780 [Paenibacillus darwinianus]EXX91489.1 hypothetical protein BG53_11225 [Paenibacillus darwinianus]EXX92132.1 hypothetical protein CH50_11930 [Paenibacillus darwinianus]
MMEMDAAARETFFYIAESRRGEALLELDWSEMSRPIMAARFLDAYSGVLQARDRDAAATYFASLLGSLCAGFHYMVLHDKAEPAFERGEAILQLFGERARQPMLLVLPPSARRMLSGTDEGGKADVKEAMERFYGDAMLPVIQTAAFTGGVRELDLWKLLATRLKYVEEQFIEQADEPEKRRIWQHFDLLYNGLSPAVFGRKHNLLNIEYRFVEDPNQPGSYLRQRAACCLAFKTGGNRSYCYTCPRITESERLQRRQAASELRAQTAKA